MSYNNQQTKNFKIITHNNQSRVTKYNKKILIVLEDFKLPLFMYNDYDYSTVKSFDESSSISEYDNIKIIISKDIVPIEDIYNNTNNESAFFNQFLSQKRTRIVIIKVTMEDYLSHFIKQSKEDTRKQLVDSTALTHRIIGNNFNASTYISALDKIDASVLHIKTLSDLKNINNENKYDVAILSLHDRYNTLITTKYNNLLTMPIIILNNYDDQSEDIPSPVEKLLSWSLGLGTIGLILKKTIDVNIKTLIENIFTSEAFLTTINIFKGVSLFIITMFLITILLSTFGNYQAIKTYKLKGWTFANTIVTLVTFILFHYVMKTPNGPIDILSSTTEAIFYTKDNTSPLLTTSMLSGLTLLVSACGVSDGHGKRFELVTHVMNFLIKHGLLK